MRNFREILKYTFYHNEQLDSIASRSTLTARRCRTLSILGSHWECGQFRPCLHKNFWDEFDPEAQLSAIESNCPSGSKSPRIFQNFHEDKHGTVHILSGKYRQLDILHKKWSVLSLPISTATCYRRTDATRTFQFDMNHVLQNLRLQENPYKKYYGLGLDQHIAYRKFANVLVIRFTNQNNLQTWNCNIFSFG